MDSQTHYQSQTYIVMSVGEIFSDAQRSAVGHKSLAKRLRRLENSPGFETQIKQCIFRLLDVGKSEVAGNRVVKFVATYIESAEASNAVTSSILLSLLPFLCAKDKTVRYRATQIVSQILSVLSAIDDDLYRVIRHELIKRLRDRVPAIRLEAVMALGRLVENELDEEQEEQDSDEDSGPSLLEKLLDVLQNDTNADVRRALLLNLPITPTTLPYLLERARDRDGPTRRALYSRLLPSLGDFRHLSLSMREKLLRWGLRDRDEKVRKAAARLFRERWIEDCAGSRMESATDEKTAGLHDPNIPALLELLERIDILNSGNEGGIALDAMKEFWAGRPDYVEAVTFEDEFWSSLTPEAAFMARTFIEYCQQDPDRHGMMEEKMPEVTRLGFYLQKQINGLVEKMRRADDLGVGEEETTEQEFILEQLLHIAHMLDYTDEMGRRKMFSLIREALALAELPEESTRLAVEVLRLVCNSGSAGEREFTSVVLEAIAEVHDTISTSDLDDVNDDESFVSARSEVSADSSDSTPKHSGKKRGPKEDLTEEEQEAKAIKEIVVHMKCLHIAQCMLQNITGNMQSNVHLETMLDNLVIPAVRSHEAPIRERGLLCLGLCCLLEPTLAQENRNLFVHCLTRGNESLQVTSIQILCDILLSTGRRGGDTDQHLGDQLAPFVKAFGFSEEVQSASTTSLCKLMLCGFYKGHEGSFDDAVDQATASAAKGWELLGKVRAAVQTTATTATEDQAAEK